MWAFARFVFWGGAAAVISGLGATAQTAPAPSAIAIPIVDDDEGVPVIEIYLNGRGPYRATFDTGAWGIEIDSDLAKELGIKTSSQGAYTGLTGKAQGLERGGPISIAFGPVSAAGVKALVSPVEQASDRTRKQIRANIGPQFVEGFAVTIDLPAHSLLLTPSSAPYAAPPGAVRLPMEEARGLELIPASVDGEKGWYCIDTGASYGVWLAQDFVQDHGLRTRFQWPAYEGHMTVYGATRRLDTQYRYALHLGSAVFTEPGVTIPEYLPDGDPSMPSAGCIGMRVLRHFRFTLDKAHRQLIIEPGESEPRHLLGPGVGLSLRSGRAIVEYVVAGGPGDQAGLRAGDELISLDGKPAATVFRDLNGSGWFVRDEAHSVHGVFQRDGQAIRIEIAAHSWRAPALRRVSAGTGEIACASPPCGSDADGRSDSMSYGGHAEGMISAYTAALHNPLLSPEDRAMTMTARGGARLQRDETDCCRVVSGESLRGDRYEESIGHRDCTAALADFEAARGEDPGDPYAYAGHAMCLVRTGRPSEALLDFDQALSLRENAPEILAERGWAYRLVGRQADALADFNAALAAPQPAARTIRGRAETLFLLGQFGAAADAFDDYSRRVPDDVYAAIWRHLALKMSGSAKADSALDIHVARSVNGSWRYRLLLLLKGEKTPADIIGDAAAADPRLAADRTCEANFYVGAFFLAKADRDAARSYLTRAATDCGQSRPERSDASAVLMQMTRNG
jgi:hypothetical protein